MLKKSSDILQNCLVLNNNTELTRSCFSSLFFNLDGNKSNFDNFAVELERHAHTFSVIGLAETNTSPDHRYKKGLKMFF